jgi:hypothetical protein
MNGWTFVFLVCLLLWARRSGGRRWKKSAYKPKGFAD